MYYYYYYHYQINHLVSAFVGVIFTCSKNKYKTKRCVDLLG